jgi:GT2 family glycosyltransferase
LLETQFYLGSLVAVRKEWLERQSGWQTPEHQESAPGDCRQMVYRLAELAGGFEKGRGRNTILHIPRILFHCDREEDQKRWLCYEEHSAEEHTARSLSVIIPSKDNPDLLEKCIRSVLNTASELQYEIVVVDNGSAAAEKRRIEALLERLRQSGMPGLGQLYYLYEPMEFNFSRMCNLGAERASGELLLFLNDDVELAAPESLRSMVRLAARPYTGAVGLKLLYPDDKAQGRIQHAGIVNLPMGPVHKLQFGRDEQVYYFGWNRGRHNALAVTAACLVVEKRKFQEVGGFDEALAVAFNDVDLCFRLYEQGYENVCECDSYAFHDESYSRGADESAEKLARLLAERRKLYERHPSLEGKDPYYSIYLNRQELDTCIRPAYETQGDFVQKVQKRQVSVDSGQKMQAYRQDNCLMVCVESVLETGDRFSGAPGTAPEKGLIITGWSVV